MNLGLWRPRIILSKENTGKKSRRLTQKYSGDTCSVHFGRPSGMPWGFRRGICERSGCPPQPSPLLWQGQDRRRDSCCAETADPRHDPAWRGKWWFSSPTCARSSGSKRVFIRVDTSPPCPHHRRKPGHRGSAGGPSQSHLPAVEAETKRRKHEDELRSHTQHNICATETCEEGLPQIQSQAVRNMMKSRVTFTNFSAKVGLNFSNQMSRLNVTLSRQGRGQLVASKRNRTELIIMRQYRLI